MKISKRVIKNILKFYSESDKAWKENQLSFNRLFSEDWWLCEEIDDVVDKKSCETCKHCEAFFDRYSCTVLPISIDHITKNRKTFFCSEYERKEN